MREKSSQLIKSCGTWTDPAAETKSIGLQADLPTGRQALELSCICPDMRSIVRGFCTSPRQFYRDSTNPAHLSGPRHLDNFALTKKPCPLTGTLQKRMPTLTQTATH